MFHRSLRVVPAAIALVLAAGCAQTPRQQTAPEPAPAPPASPGTAASTAGAAADAAPTGIEVCDTYLGRYRACHAVIGAYPAGEIGERYRAMRENLVKRASDPQTRPQAESQCRMLSTAMDEALDGRACGSSAG